MRLLKIFIQDMPRFKGDIDIDFITKQRVAEDDQEKLFNTSFLTVKLAFIQIRQFHL